MLQVYLLGCLLVVLAGFLNAGYNLDDDPDTAAIVVVIAVFWPIVVPCGLMYIIGVYLRKFMEER